MPATPPALKDAKPARHKLLACLVLRRQVAEDRTEWRVLWSWFAVAPMVHQCGRGWDTESQEATMGAERDKRPDQDEEGMSEDAGAIEGYDLQPGADDEETTQPGQEQDPPEELEEERRG